MPTSYLVCRIRPSQGFPGLVSTPAWQTSSVLTAPPSRTVPRQALELQCFCSAPAATDDDALPSADPQASEPRLHLVVCVLSGARGLPRTSSIHEDAMRVLTRRGAPWLRALLTSTSMPCLVAILPSGPGLCAPQLELKGPSALRSGCCPVFWDGRPGACPCHSHRCPCRFVY